MYNLFYYDIIVNDEWSRTSQWHLMQHRLSKITVVKPSLEITTYSRNTRYTIEPLNMNVLLRWRRMYRCQGELCLSPSKETVIAVYVAILRAQDHARLIIISVFQNTRLIRETPESRYVSMQCWYTYIYVWICVCMCTPMYVSALLPLLVQRHTLVTRIHTFCRFT